MGAKKRSPPGLSASFPGLVLQFDLLDARVLYLEWVAGAVAKGQLS